MTVYEIRHRTEYGYDDDVTASYGTAWLTPRDLPDQECTRAEVVVEPGASLVAGRRDWFGNAATYFEVHEPHTVLAVTATSRIEVVRERPDLDALEGTWEQAAARPGADDADFLLASRQVPVGGPAAPLAESVFRPGRPLGESLRALLHEIHQGFRYSSGATSVTTTLAEVMARREGVCQDFAHLAAACLRHAGLPARYVSGYLETLPPPGMPRLSGVDASHAWVSVLVPGAGWIGLDPTNDQPVDDRYVITAWGRDYFDVPPLKGVIFTESASSTLRVAVDVERVTVPG